MLRSLLLNAFLFVAGSAAAQACPEFYRFVDFGLQGQDGIMYRGGTLLRAENTNREALLLRERTTCLDVAILAKDGFGNPVPVVSSINYDPAKIGLPLGELRVTGGLNVQAIAQELAEDHRTHVARAGSDRFQGAQFLCVPMAASGVSCQIVSPFGGSIPLIATCDGGQCVLPAYGISTQLMVRASWSVAPSVIDDPNDVGQEVSKMVQQIHDFLAPLSASL